MPEVEKKVNPLLGSYLALNKPTGYAYHRPFILVGFH